MHRRGHVGIALLAYAPVVYVLLTTDRPALAVFGAIALLLVEPIPDNDIWIPWLSHRGTSHSLFCALLVGVVLGGLGWLVGERFATGFADLLAGGDVSTVGVFAGVFGWLATRVRSLDSALLARFGFVAGVSGVIVHLLGDIITVSGIHPFLPLSRRRISLSGLRADSTLANSVFLGLGVLAIALVLFATAPSIGAAGTPGVVAAQETPDAGLELDNQTSNGGTVVIDSVTLPEGGFVVIHGARYLEGVGGPAAIAVSDPLAPGTHRNVTVNLTNGVPGSPEVAQGMRESDVVTAVAYRDTNGNGVLDYFRSNSTADAPYGSNRLSVDDRAFITVEGSRADVAERESIRPSIDISNQRFANDSVTVDSATLPRGGFIVVHDQSVLPPENQTVSSAIGVTNYLPPGEHENITVPVLSGSLNRSQTVVADAHYDTNTNRTFDFVASRAREDVAYVRDGELVEARADVTVPGQPVPTSTTIVGTTSPPPTSTADPTATAISIGLGNESTTEATSAASTSAAGATATTSASTSASITTTTDAGGSDGSEPFSGLPISPMNLLIAALVVALGAVFAVRS